MDASREGGRRGRRAPRSLVSTTAPAASSGWAGSIEPRPERTATSGRSGRPRRRPELGEGLCRRGVHLLRQPRPLRRGPQHPRADEHDVGERAQQAHHEVVGLAPGRDHVVRLRDRRDRDDAVERRHEVRDEPRLVEAERAAVQALELLGELRGRRPSTSKSRSSGLMRRRRPAATARARRGTRGRSSARAPATRGRGRRHRRPRGAPRAASPVDRDDRVERAVADRDGTAGRAEVELEPGTVGTNPLSARSAAGRAPARGRARTHHRALREAAENGASRLDAGLLPERVEPLAHQRVGRRERPGVRIADLLHRVPVGAARRSRSGPRGVTPRRRRPGSRRSRSGYRSASSAPRPWKSTSRPSGSAAAAGRA